jgi:hypothetical protein
MVFKIIFPLIMTMFGRLEIFFVNGLGLPFHSGTIAAFILMVVICYFQSNMPEKQKESVSDNCIICSIYDYRFLLLDGNSYQSKCQSANEP